jgi:ubiquinone/menaquinone biosynthesis C-methylase UbiE
MKTPLLVAAAFLLLSACARSAWQRPDQVIRALSLPANARVADLGAGNGYFAFRLARAVGAGGHVYAIEIDPDRIEDLLETVAERGYTNVTVVTAEPDDPNLPDSSVDLIFLCNTYHHLEERLAYLAGLRPLLRPGGRVAIIELWDDAPGLAGLLIPSGHATPPDVMRREMEEAGYRVVENHDFLPAQTFIVYEVAPQ